MFYSSLAALLITLAKLAYDLYQQLHKPKTAVNFTIDGVIPMPLQVGKPTRYKITPRDANGNPVTAFVAGTPTPTWPGVPPTTDAAVVVDPDGMGVTDTPITTNPETLTASVVINGTAVQRSVSGTPLPGDAVDFTIDEVPV